MIPEVVIPQNKQVKKEMDVEGDDVTTLNVWTFIENHQDFYTDMAEKWNEENPDRKSKTGIIQHGL